MWPRWVGEGNLIAGLAKAHKKSCIWLPTSLLSPSQQHWIGTTRKLDPVATMLHKWIRNVVQAAGSPPPAVSTATLWRRSVVTLALSDGGGEGWWVWSPWGEDGVIGHTYGQCGIAPKLQYCSGFTRTIGTEPFRKTAKTRETVATDKH